VVHEDENSDCICFGGSGSSIRLCGVGSGRSEHSERARRARRNSTAQCRPDGSGRRAASGNPRSDCLTAACQGTSEHAAHDFGGHRVEAIRATDEAIHQLEECLKYDRK
jgi:hypothetical protein